MKKSQVIISAAVVGIIGAFATQNAMATGKKKAGKEVACLGVNECKGKGSCAAGENGCKGKNSCKGKGELMKTEKACTKAGGHVAGAVKTETNKTDAAPSAPAAVAPKTEAAPAVEAPKTEATPAQ